MANTRLYFHPSIARHDAAADHPVMSKRRIADVWVAVRYVEGIQAVWPEPLDPEQLTLAHDADYVQRLLERAPTQIGQRWALDRETVLNEHTLEALLCSAGAACQAVDDVLSGECVNAFCATYAGHHAGRRHAEGFCILNSVALAARHALSQGVQRLAVLDFDTHAGNGTIDILWEDAAAVLFAETYQKGFPGNFLNRPAPPHILRRKVEQSAQFLPAWDGLLNAVRDFRPELVLVSAGFDGHAEDPLSAVQLRDAHYERLFQGVLQVSPRVVSVLEGGYNVESTPRLAHKWVQALVQAATP